MSQFALVASDGIVSQVIVADQEFIDAGLAGDPSSWVAVIPEGTAGIGYLYDSDEGTFAPPAPTIEDLFAERSRRLAGGFDFNFQDDRGIHRIGTSANDMIGWNEVTMLAGALMALGQGQQPILIVTETGVAQITATEWQLILLAAGAFRQPIWQASFGLATLHPIPADYRSDSYWVAA